MLVIFKSRQDNKMIVTEGLFLPSLSFPLATHLKTF